ncbi:MAG TPA: hypothetical protein VJT80_00360 [Steroidobacteraceae bacterium]|nr:hypothetical protein [Steroidobacteraceae bacterium]
MRAGALGDVGDVERVIVVRVRDEDCRETLVSTVVEHAVEDAIDDGGIRLHLTEHDCGCGRSAQETVDHQLRLTVVEQQRRGSEKGHLDGSVEGMRAAFLERPVAIEAPFRRGLRVVFYSLYWRAV